MKIFSCPECGAALNAEQSTGTTVKCPYCDSPVIVPEELRPPSSIPRESGRTNPVSSRADRLTVIRTRLAVIGFFVVIILITALPMINSFWPHHSSAPDTRMNNSHRAETSASPNVISHPPVTQANIVTPTVALTFGKSGTGAGSFQNAHGITLDESGNIYVSDETSRLQKFNPAGKFLSLWTTPPGVHSGDTESGPIRLFTDETGRVCAVADGQIIKFDVATGNRVIIRDDSIDDAVSTSNGGSVLIVWWKEKSALVFLDADGNELKRRTGFIGDGIEYKVTLLSSALRLALDEHGNIFVLYALGAYNGAEHYNVTPIAVYKFSPDGRYVDKFGLEGHGPDQLDMPTAIAIDHQNRVYVSEQTGEIKVFDADGNYLMTLKTPHSVQAMAFDKDNNLYIAGAAKVSKLVLNK